MNFGRNLWIWAAVIVLLFVLFQMFQGSTTSNSAGTLSYTDFLHKVEAGDVTNVTIRGPEITVQPEMANVPASNQPAVRFMMVLSAPRRQSAQCSIVNASLRWPWYSSIVGR